jgi:Ca2+-transporting ATPase
MGAGGTELARSVAAIVLAEDDLATMAKAVAEGRTIYGNIRKAIHYLLSTNLSEILVTGGGVALGAGEVVSPIQLLWLNLVSDVLPALALALEPPEPDVMRRPPRDPAAPILSGGDFRLIAREGILISGGAIAAFLYARSRYGAGLRASSLVFHALTAAQLAHALACRSESHSVLGSHRLQPNPHLAVALPAGLVLQAATVLLPPLRRLLRTVPLAPSDLLVVASAAIGPLVVNELFKMLGRSASRGLCT